MSQPNQDDVVETTALVRPQSGLFHTEDPVEVVAKATRVADALARVVSQKRLFSSIRGKDHVKVEGWQLLGGMLGVSAVCVATERVDGGWKATVEARTVDGRVVGRADALCTKFEKSGPWKTADDYALLSMAQTRATSKALKGPLGFIVSLAGYSTTPAEEIPREEEQPITEEQLANLRAIMIEKNVEEKKCCQFYGIRGLEEMTQRDYFSAVDYLRRRRPT